MTGGTVLSMTLTVLPGKVLPVLHCLVLAVPCLSPEHPDCLHCQGKLPCYSKLTAGLVEDGKHHYMLFAC